MGELKQERRKKSRNKGGKMNKEMMAANAAAFQALLAQSGGNMNPQLVLQYNQLMQFNAMNMNNMGTMLPGMNLPSGEDVDDSDDKENEDSTAGIVLSLENKNNENSAFWQDASRREALASNKSTLSIKARALYNALMALRHYSTSGYLRVSGKRWIILSLG